MPDRLSLSDLGRLQESGDGFSPGRATSAPEPVRPVHFAPGRPAPVAAASPFPDPDADPLRAAWAEGHAAGRTQGADADTRRCAADLAARLDRLGRADEGLAERLRATVVALARQLLAEAPLDEAALDRRIARALACLGATPPILCRCHPDAARAVRALLPDTVAVVVDAGLAPNEVALSTETGGLRDGPEEWGADLARALAEC